MALNIGATVLTKFKADVSDHKRKLRQLKGEEKKLAKERIRGLEEHNAKLDKQIATLGKVAAGVAAVAGAYVTARESFETFAKRQQLLTATNGRSIEGMRRASRGLLTDMQLLEMQAKTQGSAFGSTTRELETATQAIIALTSKGHDLQEVYEEVTRALVEGNAEGLKKFGLQIKTQSDTVRGYRDILSGLALEVERTGAVHEIAGEKMTSAQVDMANAMDELKSAIGELVVELAPAIKGLAALIRGMREAAGHLPAVINALGGKTATGGLAGRIKGGEAINRAGLVGDDGRIMGNVFQTAKRMHREQEALELIAASQQRANQRLLEILAANRTTAKATTATARNTASGRRTDPFDGLGILPGRADEEGIRELQAELGVKPSGREGEVAAAMFGMPSLPGEALSGDIEKLRAYQFALDQLGASMQSGFAAWSSGAMSASEAVQKAIADVMQGLANEMWARSLLALFSGNFAAAAGFGGGAVAVGLLARQMGSQAPSAQSAPAAPRASAVGPAVSTGGSGGGSHVTVYVGSDFAPGDRRKEQQRLSRLLRDVGAAPDGHVVFA